MAAPTPRAHSRRYLRIGTPCDGKLARYFARVTGIDADAGMAAAASARLAHDPEVTICHGGFEQFASAASCSRSSAFR